MRGSMPAFLQVLMSEYTMAARYADASLPQKRMEDVLKRLPEYELGNGNLSELLPGNWQQKTATVR